VDTAFLAPSLPDALPICLERFLSIPSVSTDSTYQEDMKRASQFVEELLQDIGFDHTEIMDTAGHPLVYGTYEQAGKDAPTVLFYGHYDVQTADPLEEWE